MSLRNYTALPTLTSIATALAASTTGTADTVTVASTANFPAAPFTAGIERGQPNEECVLVTAVNVLTGVLSITRGYDGTAAPAHAADPTTTFEHVVSAIDFGEANAHVNAGVSAGHGQVQNADIATNAVTGPKIANGSIGQGHVGNGYVDLATAQTIAGSKTFSVGVVTQSGLYNNSGELVAANNGAATGRMRLTDDGTYAYFQTDRTLVFSPAYSSTQRASLDTAGGFVAAGNITSTGGSITAANGSIYSKSSTASTGYVFLTPGGTTTSGYIGFQGNNNVRQGYIGWVSSPSATADGGTVNYHAAVHAFTGNTTTSGSVGVGTSLLEAASGTYGSLDVTGQHGAYGGFNFPDVADGQTLMQSATSFGVYDIPSAAWRFFFTGATGGTAGKWELSDGFVQAQRLSHYWMAQYAPTAAFNCATATTVKPALAFERAMGNLQGDTLTLSSNNITINQTGYYLVSIEATLASSVGTARAFINVDVSGAAAWENASLRSPIGSGENIAACTWIRLMAAGVILNPGILQTSGATISCTRFNVQIARLF